MGNPKASRVVVTLAGVLLGIWMTLDGLHQRLFGEMLRPFGSDLPYTLASAAGLSPERIGWPILVVGLTWFGALGGLWLGHRWGIQLTRILALVSALYLGPGTVIGLAILGAVWLGRPGRPLAPQER